MQGRGRGRDGGEEREGESGERREGEGITVLAWGYWASRASRGGRRRPASLPLDPRCCTSSFASICQTSKIILLSLSSPPSPSPLLPPPSLPFASLFCFFVSLLFCYFHRIRINKLLGAAHEGSLPQCNLHFRWEIGDFWCFVDFSCKLLVFFHYYFFEMSKKTKREKTKENKTSRKRIEREKKRRRGRECRDTNVGTRLVGNCSGVPVNSQDGLSELFRLKNE